MLCTMPFVTYLQESFFHVKIISQNFKFICLKINIFRTVPKNELMIWKVLYSDFLLLIGTFTLIFPQWKIYAFPAFYKKDDNDTFVCCHLLPQII